MRKQEDPSELAARLERAATVPDGDGDRFVGYSVMGVPFRGGDVLALRRFPATSLGPPYTSVWHRAPDGRWTFYADVPANQGCSTYWHGVIDRTVVAPIRLEWTGPGQLAVSVDSGRLVSWSLTLAHTQTTALLNRVAGVVPARWWQNRLVSRAIGAAAGLLLRAGSLTLTGQTPAGHRFTAMPQAIRLVSSSRASVQGRDLGTPGAFVPPARLGEFTIPNRGLFAAGVISMQRRQP